MWLKNKWKDLGKNTKHPKVSKNTLLFIRNVEFLEVAYKLNA